MHKGINKKTVKITPVLGDLTLFWLQWASVKCSMHSHRCTHTYKIFKILMTVTVLTTSIEGHWVQSPGLFFFNKIFFKRKGEKNNAFEVSPEWNEENYGENWRNFPKAVPDTETLRAAAPSKASRLKWKPCDLGRAGPQDGLFLLDFVLNVRRIFESFEWGHDLICILKS